MQEPSTQAEVLISAFRGRGIQLEVEGEQIAVSPLSKLSGADRQAIRAHKAELLALLKHDRDAGSEDAALPPFPSDPYERAGAVARYCEANGIDVSIFLDEHPELCSAAVTSAPNGWTPAHSIIASCQRYGVALRIDPATGDLVVGKTGAKADESTQPWPSLLAAIEAHLEAVARLVATGWTLKADLPQQGDTYDA